MAEDTRKTVVRSTIVDKMVEEGINDDDNDEGISDLQRSLGE